MYYMSNNTGRGTIERSGPEQKTPPQIYIYYTVVTLVSHVNDAAASRTYLHTCFMSCRYVYVLRYAH